MVALRSLARFSMTRGGEPEKERLVREEMRMGVPFAERTSLTKRARLVEKSEREMFFSGFWSLWPNCGFV